MKHILLLTDFSENSINAMHYALDLLKDENCLFYVLHVKSSSAYTSDDLILSGNDSVYSAVIKTVKNKLDAIVTVLKIKYPNNNFKFKTIVDYDNLTDAIEQVVTSKHIALVVMGSNGVTGAKEIIFGSNTINVIRNVTCDTLVIPEQATYTIPKEVLLPLDTFDSLNGHAFLRSLEFLKDWQCTLNILRINPNGILPDAQSKDLEHIAFYLKEVPYTYEVVNNIPMHEVVNGYIQTNDIDLTVLLVQNESLFERFFMGSPTTKIGNQLQAPLLVCHSD